MQHTFITLLSIGLFAALGHAAPVEQGHLKVAVPVSAPVNSGPASVRNPDIPLSPARSRAMTAEEAATREQEKIKRNPMTMVGPAGPLGWRDPASNATIRTTLGMSRNSSYPEGITGGQYNTAARWGANTTVMTGIVAHGSPASRSISVDYDSATSIYYALVGRDTTVGYLMVYASDDLVSWYPIWAVYTGASTMPSSKLIVVHSDTLLFYCFYVEGTGKAGVLRLNNSSGAVDNYILMADSALAIAAAWDLDKAAPWFHVAIERAGAVNNRGIYYVRGVNYGKTWSAPAWIAVNAAGPSIAVGNIAGTNNNLFMGVTFSPDSSAYVIYDSSGTWAYQQVGINGSGKNEDAQIAASHSYSSDSVRVWLAYTQWTGGSNRDIMLAYNRNNARGAWNKGLYVPGASTEGRQEWGSSLNVPSWVVPGSINADVELSYYSDSGSSYRVERNYLSDGWNYPWAWGGKTLVNDHPHSLAALSYATRVRLYYGAFGPIVMYPGAPFTDVYCNASWFTGVADSPISPAGPVILRLERNAPNPMRGRTTIDYQLRSPAMVNVAIYNIAGQLVAPLVDGMRTSGRHSVSWDGRDHRGHAVPAGVYLYRLRAGGASVTRKLTVIK